MSVADPFASLHSRAATAAPASVSADYVAHLAAAQPGRGSLARSAVLALFLAAFVANLWFVTFNWRSGFLIGHEFRQSQTALITDWIDRQNNFSLRYDTPIFGKPWGAPLEWPLYEWCVVLVKRATGWPAHEAARAVSATFFYLTLPAIFRLLGHAGVPRERRWLALALVLCCPAYIFYSRAFLIESAALCFSAWFLAAFAEMLRSRRWSWLVLAGACGAVAGLIKSLTFAAWVAPAAALGAWTLWTEWRGAAAGRERWPRLARTVAWGCGAMVAPVALTLWWTQFADAIKAQNPATEFITSRALSQGNYGTFSLAARFSGETWRALANGWSYAVMPPWCLALCVFGGVVVAGRHRTAMLVALALFFVPQLAIPYAYGGQDYYFYAANAFLMASLGFALLGVLEKPWPQWVRVVCLLVPFAGLWAGYFRPSGYWDMQKVRSPGGSGLSDALRVLTPPDSVLLIAGYDWNATIAYYARRRAFMMTNGREHDTGFIARQIAALDGEEISALVLSHHVRGDQALADFIAAQADLDPRPAFSHPVGEVYLSRRLRDAAVARLLAHGAQFHAVTTTATATPAPPPGERPHELSPGDAALDFPVVSPAPIRAQSKFGFGVHTREGRPAISAHPEASLWVPAPARAGRITWDFGIDLTGSPHPDGATDGVEFVITGETPNGARRRIFGRELQPVKIPADRGKQHVELNYTPLPGEVLIFETRHRLTYAYDWAYWTKIEVR